MDKQLLKAYIRTIVEEEVQRILPQLLQEAVSEIKQLQETNVSRTSSSNTPQKQKIDRSKLAQMMGISYDGQTLRATTNGMAVPLPENAPRDVDPEIVKAVTKDYSALMKKMGLT